MVLSPFISEMFVWLLKCIVHLHAIMVLKHGGLTRGFERVYKWTWSKIVVECKYCRFSVVRRSRLRVLLQKGQQTRLLLLSCSQFTVNWLIAKFQRPLSPRSKQQRKTRSKIEANVRNSLYPLFQVCLLWISTVVTLSLLVPTVFRSCWYYVIMFRYCRRKIATITLENDPQTFNMFLFCHLCVSRIERGHYTFF